MMRRMLLGIGCWATTAMLAVGLLKSNASRANEPLPDQPELLSSTPDLPQPFGYKASWLAVRTTDTSAVFDAIGLEKKTIANWSSGIQFSYSGDYLDENARVFVTPPVNGWNLVLTQFAFNADSEKNVSSLEALLNRLSADFGASQYFGSYRIVDYIAWYRSENGNIVRGFSYADGTLFSNIGSTTQAELSIGVFDLPGMTVDTLWETILEIENDSGPLNFFDEERPMQIAEYWSVNPLSLGTIEGIGPATGLAGYYAK